jgi:hypothetical protein
MPCITPVDPQWPLRRDGDDQTTIISQSPYLAAGYCALVIRWLCAKILVLYTVLSSLPNPDQDQHARRAAVADMAIETQI